MKSLRQQIEEYPALLHKALEDRTKWAREVERLEAEEEECDEEETSIIFNDSAFEDDKKIAKLDASIEKLEIQLAQAEGYAEAEHRAINPKATESSSRAAVRSNDVVVATKLEIVSLKEEKELLEIGIREARAKAKIDSANRCCETSNTDYSNELEEAMSCLRKSENNIMRIEAMFESYKLLVSLGKGE
jgi:chromosome segregation ATPase